MPVFTNSAARGGATSRREARGDLRGTQGPPKLHKIITHNVTDDPEAIRSVWNRFGRLYFFLVGCSYSCPDSCYRIESANHVQYDIACFLVQSLDFSLFSLTCEAKLFDLELELYNFKIYSEKLSLRSLHFRRVFRAAATFRFCFLELKIGFFGIFSSGGGSRKNHENPENPENPHF